MFDVYSHVVERRSRETGTKEAEVVPDKWRQAHRESQNPATTIQGLAVLRNWPNLGEIPADQRVKVAKICALLWRKPSASALIPLLLETDPVDTAALLTALVQFGHVKIVNPQTALVEGPGAEQVSVFMPDDSGLRKPVVRQKQAPKTKPAGVVGKVLRRWMGP